MLSGNHTKRLERRQQLHVDFVIVFKCRVIDDELHDLQQVVFVDIEITGAIVGKIRQRGRFRCNACLEFRQRDRTNGLLGFEISL